MLRLFCLGMAFLAGLIFASRIESWNAHIAAAVFSTLQSPIDERADAEKIVSVPFARDQFTVRARINGRALGFQVDTGAALVSLTESDARSAGIVTDATMPKIMLVTANGLTTGTRVKLPRIDVAGIIMHDVDAVVFKGTGLSQSLLGMSFLGRLRSFKYEKGYLELRR